MKVTERKKCHSKQQTYFYQIGNSRCLVVLHSSKLLQGKMDSTKKKKNQLRNDIP